MEGIQHIMGKRKITNSELSDYTDSLNNLVDVLMKGGNRTMDRVKMYDVASRILAAHIVATEMQKQNELLQGIKEILFIQG